LAAWVGFGLVTDGVGWIGGLAGALSMSGGFFGIGAGAGQVATASSRTPQQEAQVNEGIGLTMSISSLGGLLGGLGGLAMSGDENGLRLGAAVGGLAEGMSFAGLGIRRAYQLEDRFRYAGSAFNWDSNLKRRIREAYNLAFTRAAETRPNTLFTQGFESLELSHLVPQEWFKESRFARSIFNRPLFVKPLWASEHALVDLSRNPGAAFWAVYGSPYPIGIRLIYNMPRWLQETAYGSATSGKAIEYYQPAPTPQRPGLQWWREPQRM